MPHLVQRSSVVLVIAVYVALIGGNAIPVGRAADDVDQRALVPSREPAPPPLGRRLAMLQLMLT